MCHIFILKCRQDKLGKLTVCMHKFADILDGSLTVKKELDILRQAPMVIDHELDLLCIGNCIYLFIYLSETIKFTCSRNKVPDIPQDFPVKRHLCELNF